MLEAELRPPARRRTFGRIEQNRGVAPRFCSSMTVSAGSVGGVPAPDPAAVLAQLTDSWESSVVPTISEYIAVPALSPAFDAEWATTGHIDAVVDLALTWARPRLVAIDSAATLAIHRLPGRTPLIFGEVPATAGADPAAGTVLIYGHLDKQPEMVGWREGLSAWKPVRDGDVLYGRGGADDGYAIFSAVTALEALTDAGGEHGRIVIVIEACEESGSPDLPAHLQALADRIGDVRLVIGLDSGAGSYDRLWITDSLRGLVGGTLSVDVLTEGVHSGNAGGIVPSSFRILRQLLSRVEDPMTGEILVPELRVDVPPSVRDAVSRTIASGPGADIAAGFPWAGGTHPPIDDPVELTLLRNWGSSLSVTGMDGIPPVSAAGNVLRPRTSAHLSFRVPPTADATAAAAAVKTIFEADPPDGAVVTFSGAEAASGWAAKQPAPWLSAALDAASVSAFGLPAAWRGEGGTIPFMGMLGAAFPEAEFVITGVLGPKSNAHGPNEFLHIPCAIRVTAAVVDVLHAHAAAG